MKPALTAEEWASVAYPPKKWEVVFDGPAPDVDILSDHAIAALALLGKPYGFTRKHVGALRTAALEIFDPELKAGLREIAMLLELLLPPECPTNVSPNVKG